MPPSPSPLASTHSTEVFRTLKKSQQQQETVTKNAYEIIDIRDPDHPIGDLREQILEGLDKPESAKSISTLVLYDEKGLQLFDQITYLEEYYLTNAEIDILEKKAEEIVAYIKDGGVIVELGAGSLRKTSLLLRALEKYRRNLTYYALDLERAELEKSLSSLGSFKNVTLRGLHGTYDDGARWLQSNTHHGPDVQRSLLWLGSSIGNFTRNDAAQFLQKFHEDALRTGDLIFIGIDRRNEPERVRVAYNDPKGLTRDFIMNGLNHVNNIVNGKDSGHDFINQDAFEYYARYNESEGRHEAYYISKQDQTLEIPKKDKSIEIKENEKIHIEFSYKYSPHEVNLLGDQTGLYRIASWPDTQQQYDLHLFQKPPFYFATSNQPAHPVPSLDEWKSLWAAWDTVTMGMVTPSMYHEKPIDLRHPLIFYFGHIPAFLDIQLARHFKEPYTHPTCFAEIFERGIDPDMEDQTKCNPHSIVPTRKEDWPSIDEITAFRDRVRARLTNVLAKPIDRRAGRVIWMTFEHEVMHLETILYMLVQSPNVQTPPGFEKPLWALRRDGVFSSRQHDIIDLKYVEDTPVLNVPSGNVILGHNDIESQDSTDSLTIPYGWDNESPQRSASHVKAFRIQSHPVTNSQYLAYLTKTNAAHESYPLSWTRLPDQTWAVKTVYGPASILDTEAAYWPVQIPYEMLTAYAQSLGGRVMTEEEIIRARDYFVKENVNKYPNHSFRAWHPTPVSAKLPSLSFRSDIWEWTSTSFMAYPSFKSSEIYPGYSSDFFDEKHNVILGASWATHSRVAERPTFRNWYQRGYGYVFAGGRVAWDM